MKSTKTAFQKIWDSHVVIQEEDSPAVLYIDLHLVHEVTSPQAFSGLRSRALRVRHPEKTVATVDHGIPTLPSLDGTKKGRLVHADDLCRKQINQLEENCKEFGIPLYGLESENQGIIHVIAPELGLIHPGMTVVCGDSHTSTHGAFGALAFGIGTSEVEHVLATQCLLQRKPSTFRVKFEGNLPRQVVSKDMILALIARIGVGGGTGCVLEYTGNAIRSLSMEQRMTICNMSIECGARAGLIPPDDTTFEYLAGKQFSPQNADWDVAISKWRALASDEDAVFDKEITLDVSRLAPMITFGVNPGMGIPVDGLVPDPAKLPEVDQRENLKKALDYMGLQPGTPLLGKKIDAVFIGSCTNGRIEDLVEAASILQGKKVSPSIRVLVVPGSQQVKQQAEEEGLDRIFKEAGAEWREPGCSMCIAMNGDQLQPGEYAVSTSNRNFEGRQGKGGRTFLASPLTAAASAIKGCVTDVRTI